MYACKHFKAYELVPKILYEKRGEKAIELLDKELLIAIDYIREKLNVSITINDWKWGGQYQYRGIRTPECAEYSITSQHPYGKALDFKASGVSAESVNKWIIEHRNDPELRAISFIEMGMTWTHIDTRPDVKCNLTCWWTDGTTKIFSRNV